MWQVLGCGRSDHEHFLSGPSLWLSDAAQESRLYAGGTVGAGAGHRREYCAFQRGIRRVAETVAVRAGQRAGSTAAGVPQSECDERGLLRKGVAGLSRAGEVTGAD